MLNIKNAGRVSYEAATPRAPLTFHQKLLLNIFLVKDVLKVLILSIPIIIRAVLRIFYPKPKKSIIGQTALVTGGGNGIGRAIALELAQKGCNVIILDVDTNAAVKTANDVKSYGVKGISYTVDISDKEALKDIKQKIDVEVGPVDILINNACLVTFLSIRGPLDDISKIVDVNVKGQIWTTRLFLKDMMSRKRGHIVAINSITAFHQLSGALLYSAGKCFVKGFMTALQEELRQSGYDDCIHLTSVYPYFVATRKDLMGAINLRFPPLSPEEVANITVASLQRNIIEVGAPEFAMKLYKSLMILPYEIQKLARDYIFKEHESRAI